MPTMNIPLELVMTEAAADVDLEVEFTYRAGRPIIWPSLNDPGEPAEGPEVEVERVSWLYVRPRRPDDVRPGIVLADYLEVPLAAIPDSIMDAIIGKIAEDYVDEGPEG